METYFFWKIHFLEITFALSQVKKKSVLNLYWRIALQIIFNVFIFTLQRIHNRSTRTECYCSLLHCLRCVTVVVNERTES